MATGQAGEAELARINERLEKLNKDFEETVKQSKAANNAIQAMGDTIQNLGNNISNIGDFSSIFKSMRDSAVESASTMGKSFTESLNDITKAIEKMPEAFSKDVTFIDVNKLTGQFANAEDKINLFNEKVLQMAANYEAAMKRIEDINKEIGIKLTTDDYGKTTKTGRVYKSKEIKELEKERDLLIETNKYRKGSYDYATRIINSLEEYNKRVAELKRKEEEIARENERILEFKKEIANIKYTDTQSMNVDDIQKMYADYEMLINKSRELEKEGLGDTLEYKNIKEKISAYNELLNKMRQQDQLIADMVNKELELKNAKQQQLVNEVKQNAAEEQRLKKLEEQKKKLEEQAKEAERQLEVRKEIAKIKQTNVIAMSLSDVRQMYSNVEQLAKEMRELEKAGQSNSKQYKENKEKLNAYIAKLKEAGINMESFKNASNKAKNVLSSLASQFGIVFSVSGILKFMQNIIKITGEFELQEKALGAIIQNQQKANDMFYKLQIMATKSPYNIQQLVSYNRQLAAYRVETEKLLPTMKMLGDVAAGVGVDMQRLILAYGQVKAANYLRGQELRQFSEAGINILGELATKFGEVEGKAISTGEVFERVSKRMVTFEDVNDVFERFTKKGGIFYEMQQKQAETLRGQIKNLGDAFKIEANKIGSSVSDTVKLAVGLVKNLMKSLPAIINAVKFLGVAYLAYKTSMTIAIAQEKAHAASMDATGQRVGLLTFKFNQLSAAVRNFILQMQIGDKASKGGFASFLLGGGWAGALIALSSASISIYNSIQQVNKEIEQAMVRSIELRNTLRSEQFFGQRKSGENAGLDWIGIYEKEATTLEKKISSVDRMLSNLQQRGIDISYTIDMAADNAEKRLDEFAKGLSDLAEQYVEIGKKVEETRIANDSWWKSVFGRGDRGFFDESSKKDAQQLLATASDIDLYYEKNVVKYIGLIEDFIEKSENYKSLTDSQKKAIQEQYQELDRLNKLENQNLQTKRAQLRAISNIAIMTAKTGKLSDIELQKMINMSLQFERRMIEVTNEFMTDLDTFEKKLKEGTGGERSTEFAKRMVNAIRKEFPELTQDLQMELMKKVFSQRYKINIDPRIYFDNAQIVEGMTDWDKYVLKTVNETQIKHMEGMSDNVKKAMEESFDIVNLEPLQEEATEMISKSFKNLNSSEIQESLVHVLEPIGDNLEKQDLGFKKATKQWLIVTGKTAEEAAESAHKQGDAIKRVIRIVNEGKIQVESLINELEQIRFDSAVIKSLKEGDLIAQMAIIKNIVKPGLQEMADTADETEGKFGGIAETTKSTSDTFKQEFNTMINFIKKLNTETEKLNKTFDISTSLEKVRKSYQKEFESMPKEFKNMFSDLMDIDFSDRNAIIVMLRRLEELAETGKYKKQAEELKRAIEAVISPMEAEMDIQVKVDADKELQRQVEDAFSDYEITVELQKLGIDADTAKNFFGLDYTDLNTLQKKIFNMQKQFTGKDAVKDYRSYIDKLFKITDKANLEAVKKYSKYLQYEMSERVRVEMEYQKQMGEVYGSSAFTEEQKTDIIGNLEKEMKKKLQKMDWDEFKATDYYIEMFQNLEFASTSAINTMITKLSDLRDSMSELDATQVKEITKQMEALEDEMIRRNPFKSLISSMKEWNKIKKEARDNEEYKSVLPEGYEIESTGKMLNTVIDEIDKKLNVTAGDGKKGLIDLRNEAEKTWQSAKAKESAEDILGSIEAIERAQKLGINIDTSSVEAIQNTMDSLKTKITEARQEYSKLLAPQTTDADTASKYKEEESSAQSLYNVLGNLFAAYSDLGEQSGIQASVAKDNFDDLNKEVENYQKIQKKAKDDVANQKVAIKSIKQLAEAFQQVNEKSKGVFDSIMDNLDYLGGKTDANTEAWKEFGDAIFDTVTSALTMIPMLVTGFTTAGEAINASMGIIGLIAEAIQLTITLAKALAKIHDNKLEAQITTYTKKIDDLKKAYDRYQKAFDAAWDYNKMRRFYDLAQATAEQQIQTYKNMIAVEEDKKKADEEKIEEWKDAIEELQEEILDNREKIMNELGGFGSEEDMGSAAEQFASAWYDAFLETGSGLQALEDTFQSFLENIVKKQLLLRGSQQILGPLFTSINEMLSDGRADAEEVAAIIDRWNNETIGQLNAYYESLGQMFQAAGVGGGLEGLQQGIQGVTEDTAAIIASYMNTIRFDVAQQNNKLDTIVQTLQLDTATNPLLHNLRIIAQHTSNIDALLDSVVSTNPHPLGGSGIKVFMD